jgi:DNA polymerase-1
MASNPKGHLYLVDGSSYIFRAFHALPPMTRSDGTPVNAVLGFCNMLYKLLEDTKNGDEPTHFAVIMDAGRKSFRNEIYEDYKAHRPPAPEELVPQFSIIRDAVNAFNVPCIEMENYEADDLIATYTEEARKRDWDVTLVSSDKDLMQLVDDHVDMLDTMKNRRIDRDGVMEKFGVPPEKVVDVQALAGDSTDNIPGVPGIGVKTAAQLIEEYGDLETLLANADKIKQPKRREKLIENAELARISMKLVTLKRDVPFDEDLDSFTVREPEAGALLEFLDEQEFQTLKTKIISRLGADIPADVQAGIQAGLQADLAEFTPEKAEYETVTIKERLDHWIEAASKAGVVAIDTETTSLDAMTAELVGLSLSVEAGSACYIPVGHKGDATEGFDFDGKGAPEQLDRDAVLEALKDLFQDPGVLKVGQNLKYDILVLRKYGVQVAPIDDTMLISYALEAGMHGHGMDELSELHLGHKPISFKEVAGTGKSQVTFDRVPIDKATDYAAEDADITGRLYRLLKPRLVKDGVVSVYETMDRPLAQVLADMEYAGVKVDPDLLRKFSNDFAGRMADLETEITKLAGREFNINSPKQLGEILFDEMGLEGGKKGKTGAYGTGADVLEGLAAEGHDLPARVLDYRQLAKLKSTYTDALQSDINPATGRIHTSYSLASTTTGRLASNDPNLQNIPIRSEEGRKIRTAFIAEDGMVMMAADYSQIELRLVAHMAGIDPLRDAFEKGQDIHAMTASEVFGVPIKDMDPMVRRQAKAINFGIIYGISAFGLARQLGVPQKEAKSYIDEYFKRFPGIRDYMDETIAFCKRHGYVETLFGRRAHIQAINDKNPARRGFGERAAINAPIQGTAADIIRRAMIRMAPALDKAGLKARMLMQVHDELVFEVPEDELDQTRDIVREVMEGAAAPAVNLSVPLTVDVGVGANWDEAH